MEKTVRIFLKQGTIATNKDQKATVQALGLKYRHACRVVKDTPEIRGMVSAVSHLVTLQDEVSFQVRENSIFGNIPEYDLGPIPVISSENEKEKKKSEAKKANVGNGGKALESVKPVKKSSAKQKLSSNAKAVAAPKKVSATRKVKSK